MSFMKLNINVTQENIDNARPSTKCACPIALAVMDEVRESHGADPKSSKDFASIDHNKGRVHIERTVEEDSVQRRYLESFAFPLPASAQQFIADRDGKKPVMPFAFSVTAKFTANP